MNKYQSNPQTIELKEPWRNEYLKWICGFVNTQCNALYIGTKKMVKYEVCKELETECDSTRPFYAS